MATKKSNASQGQSAMSVINTHITNGTFSKIYLLFGDCDYLLKQYKNNLKEALVSDPDDMNFTHYKGAGTDIDAVLETADTMPFFADRRVVLVEDSDIFKASKSGKSDSSDDGSSGSDNTDSASSENDNSAADDNKDKKAKRIISRMQELPDTTCLIFYEHNVDKRTKLYKEVASLGTVLCFDTPDANMLTSWVLSLIQNEGMMIEKAAVDRLLAQSGQDMTQIFNETQKLISYCIETKKITVKDVEAICINPIEDKVFDMTAAIAAHNKALAIKLYNDLLLLNEAPMKIIALIYRQFNIMLQIKALQKDNVDYNSFPKITGQHPYTIKLTAPLCKNYTYDELLAKANICIDAGHSVRTGMSSDKDALLSLVMNLL